MIAGEKPIIIGDTSKMTEAEFTEIHTRNCIGGSEAASVFDLSPWTCSAELFARKSGKDLAIKKEFNVDNKLLGHIFERYVQDMFIAWFQKQYNIALKLCSTIEEFNLEKNAIFNDKHWYQCGRKNPDGSLKYWQAVANIDGLIKINGRIGIMEYKTTTPHGEIGRKTTADWKNGKPKIYYDMQCRHYMGVTNLDYAFLVGAWGFNFQDFAVIHIDRDMDKEAEIFDKELSFCETIRDGKIWDTSKCDPTLLSNFYTRLYGPENSKAPTVVLPVSYFGMMKGLAERKIERKALEKKIEEMDKKDDELISIIAPIVKDSPSIICRNNGEIVKIAIKTPKCKYQCTDIKGTALTDKAGLNFEKLKKDHPEMIDQYTETAFNTAAFKADNTALYNQYKREATPTGSSKIYTAEVIQL